MKRCPTCEKTFTEENLSFCIDDGTPLVPFDDEETVVHPSAAGSAANASAVQDYQPPAYVPPGGYQPKQKAWPWVLGIVVLVLIFIIGASIVAAILVPKILRASSNNANNVNVDRPENNNQNLNRNSNQNENHSIVEDDTPAPTDEAQVLSQLTDLENEWTVANINADKKKLDRILADDYVSTLSDGRQQGKAEYLKTIERDETIQRWDFQDLKVSLKGDRATLSGIIRLQVQGQEETFSFTDKFVWRDGRWQATGSEVSRIQ